MYSELSILNAVYIQEHLRNRTKRK